MDVQPLQHTNVVPFVVSSLKEDSNATKSSQKCPILTLIASRHCYRHWLEIGTCHSAGGTIVRVSVRAELDIPTCHGTNSASPKRNRNSQHLPSMDTTLQSGSKSLTLQC